MNTLVIDTSTVYCSVAVFSGGACIGVADKLPRAHNRHLLPMIKRTLTTARLNKGDIQCLAYGVGPGSFVGVRLSAAVMQAMSLSLNVPVVGFSSMQAAAIYYAVKYQKGGKIAVILDARMGDVYLGVYQCSVSGTGSVCLEERCLPVPEVDAVLTELKAETVIGDSISAVQHKPEKFEVYPDCRYLLPLVNQCCQSAQKKEQFQNALPVYLQGVKNWWKIGQ